MQYVSTAVEESTVTLSDETIVIVKYIRCRIVDEENKGDADLIVVDGKRVI